MGHLEYRNGKNVYRKDLDEVIIDLGVSIVDELREFREVLSISNRSFDSIIKMIVSELKQLPFEKSIDGIRPTMVHPKQIHALITKLEGLL